MMRSADRFVIGKVLRGFAIGGLCTFALMRVADALYVRAAVGRMPKALAEDWLQLFDYCLPLFLSLVVMRVIRNTVRHFAAKEEISYACDFWISALVMVFYSTTPVFLPQVAYF